MSHLFLSPLMSIIDDTGAPLAGGTMEFYEGNTTTPKAVYLDSSLTTSAGTSIELTPEGRTGDSDGDPAAIFMPSGQYYKIVTKDSLGNIIPVSGYTNYFTGTDSATSINTITTDTTINVPADYDTEQEAWEYLADITIAPNVTVTINIAAGSYTHDAAMRPHPQGNQIISTGTTVSAFPVESDYVITGTSSGARATDNAAHLVMLKSKFGVEIICDGCGYYDGRSGVATHPYFKNKLVYKPAAAADYQEDVGWYLYGGLQYMTHMALHGFDENVGLTNGGQLRGNVPFSASATGYLSLTAAGGYGVQVSDESSLKFTRGVICCSNTSTGFFLKRAGSGEGYGLVSKGNGGHGLSGENGGGMFEAADAVIKDNAMSGAKTALGFELSVAGSSAVISGNGNFGLFASGGRILASSATITDNTSGGATAVEDGYVNVNNAEVHTNGSFGVKSQGTGRIDANEADIHDNAQVGIYADYGSIVYAVSALVYDNASQGLLATNGARIIANSAQVYGNGGAGVNAEYEGYVNIRSGIVGTNGNPNANGILVQNGGKVDAQDAQIKYNTGRGLYCIGRGIIDASASSSAANLSNNTGAEIQVTIDADVYIANITGLVAGDISGYWDKASNAVRGVNIGLFRTNIGAEVDYTIASGAITITNAHLRVDTEAAAATDDLDTINGGVKGDEIFLRSANSSRDPRLVSGGNINIPAPITLTTTAYSVKLVNYDGNNWMVPVDA